MRNFILILLLAMTSASAESQTLTFSQILNRPELKTTQPDHKIAYGKEATQYGELWLPPATTKGPLPVVVLIHGGCWLADLPGPELVAFLSDDLRKNGVAVWSLTYRRVGHNGGGYPGTFNDVANGVAHLRSIAEKYNLDLTRAVVTGHSAGGHLALWVAAQNRIPASSALKRDQAVRFKAVIGVAGIPDLAHFARVGAHACGDKTVDQLTDAIARTPADGAKNVPFLDTSPSEMLPLGVKQILMHGVFDGIVPPAIGLRYQTRAKESGDSVELIALENSGHFELIAPWTPPGKAVVAKILEALK
ncbi:MAG: alpha/beta hydrolase [Burkholderiales bacterium]|nr:alpha/beta hydrolase [Burkholderiales bacterium]